MILYQDPVSWLSDSFFNHFPSYAVDDALDAFSLSMDFPGVKKEDIKLETIGNKIKIVAKRKGKGSSNWDRTFEVPDGVDLERVQASLNDGVLTITMPKAKVANPRVIKID